MNDVHEIADLLIEKFNHNVVSTPEMRIFPQIADSEDFATLLQEFFNEESLGAFLYSDFTQGMLFGMVCAFERMQLENEYE